MILFQLTRLLTNEMRKNLERRNVVFSILIVNLIDVGIVNGAKLKEGSIISNESNSTYIVDEEIYVYRNTETCS